MQKDRGDALALIAESVEILQREIDNLTDRLRSESNDEACDFALQRLQEVRDQLEATRLRTQRLVVKVFTPGGMREQTL
jgi:hypothetical protein